MEPSGPDVDHYGAGAAAEVTSFSGERVERLWDVFTDDGQITDYPVD